MKPMGHFCLQLHCSLPPLQDMLLHAIPAHFHIFRQSGPRKREKQHMMCSPCPYTGQHSQHRECVGSTTLAQHSSMDRCHTVLLACKPASWGQVPFRKHVTVPSARVKGKIHFSILTEAKNATVLWNSLQIVSFY